MHDGRGGMEDMQHMHMVFVLFFRDRRTQFANRIKYPDRTVLVKQWLVIRANVRHDVILVHHVFPILSADVERTHKNASKINTTMPASNIIGLSINLSCYDMAT